MKVIKINDVVTKLSWEGMPSKAEERFPAVDLLCKITSPDFASFMTSTLEDIAEWFSVCVRRCKDAGSDKSEHYRRSVATPGGLVLQHVLLHLTLRLARRECGK